MVGEDGLTRAPDGTLYVADSTAGIQAINPRSGQVTDLTGPVPTDGYGLAFDFQGRVLTQAATTSTGWTCTTNSFASIATGIDYPEGMEVEPPHCWGLPRRSSARRNATSSPQGLAVPRRDRRDRRSEFDIKGKVG